MTLYLRTKRPAFAVAEVGAGEVRLCCLNPAAWWHGRALLSLLQPLSLILAVTLGDAVLEKGS